MTFARTARRAFFASTASSLLLASGCSTAPPLEPPMGVLTINDAERAVVILQPVSGSTVSGQLQVERFGSGVRITGHVRGLPRSGEYAIRITEGGDCVLPGGMGAGAIFNPHRTLHGRGAQGAHMAGDMDNIVAGPGGVAVVEAQLPGVTLGGGDYNDIAARGIVVHANPDDYTTQPDGNAGARVACGAITVTLPPPPVKK